MREKEADQTSKELNVTTDPSSTLSKNYNRVSRSANKPIVPLEVDRNDEETQDCGKQCFDSESIRDEEKALDFSFVGKEEDMYSQGINKDMNHPKIVPHTKTKKSLLGQSLRILTENITEYMCSSKSLEPISDSPYNTNDQAWPNGNCMCCGRCRTCLMACSDGENDTSFFSKELEEIRLNFEYEINMLMALPQDQEMEWRDTACSWFTSNGIQFDKKAITTSNSKEMKSMLFRNRSHIINARANKIERLRNQMHLNDSSKVMSLHELNRENVDYPNGSHHPVIRMVKSEDQEPLSKEHSNTQEDEPITKKIMEVLSLEPKEMKKKNIEDDDLCYDSDPETYNRARTDKHSIILASSSNQLEDFTDNIPQIDEGSTWSISLNNDPSFEEKASFLNIHNSDLVSSIIEELTNKTETVVWHPSRNHQNKDISPICVQAWFEMGSRLQSRVIQPKFMWRNAYENANDTKQVKIMAASTATPHDVELLSIIRVLKPDSIDRDEYPFAKLKNSFILHSSDEDVFVFECTSQQERDRFVHGLKLLVARLASKIIVGDEKVFEEFFTPWGLLSSRLQEKGYKVDYSSALQNDDSLSSSSIEENSDSMDGSSVHLNSSDTRNSRDLWRANPVSRDYK